MDFLTIMFAVCLGMLLSRLIGAIIHHYIDD
ncbi:hypothetical protein LCGC14_1392150 [marine sediment metagenome]|uniref:Uncharacterized protein n=1 Tax=marine sediment metagenome TaxID=412755 RepID=A0A0F9MF82_9ZZZZ